MKSRGYTLIEMIIVIFVVILLGYLCILGTKALINSVEIQSSLPVIKSLLGLGRNTAINNGFYAGIYFYDQNDAACAMEVIEKKPINYNLPYIELMRLDGSPIHKLGDKGYINESVILFSKSGRLTKKNIGIYNYIGISDVNLVVDGANYYINSYTGQFIK